MRFYEVYESMLQEAVEYDSVLNPFLKIVSSSEEIRKAYKEGAGIDDPVVYFKNIFKDHIKDAKNEFRQLQGKQLWIMYIAKLITSGLANNLLNAKIDLDQNTKNALQRVVKIPDVSYGKNLIKNMIRSMGHYTAYNFEPIKKYNPMNKPTRAVLEDLAKLEEEYQERFGDDDRMLELQDGDKIIHDFGNGYVWIMLSRGACSDESDAMGHCGNLPSQQSGDRIISFRKKRPQGKTMFYEPFMTFIYNERTKKLGEMKGRANEKPVKKYHPYIVWLLKQDFIKGFGPRGYAPDDDFQLDDLSPEQYKEVTEANPWLLLNFGTPLKHIPSSVLETIDLPFTNKMDKIWYDKEKNKFYFNADVTDVVDKHIMDTLEDPWRSYNTADYGNDDMDSFLSDLSMDNIKKLFKIFNEMLEESGVTPDIEFDEFSKQVQRSNFHGILEEYLDEDDEPIDFEANSVYENLRSQTMWSLDTLEIHAWEKLLSEKIYDNLKPIIFDYFEIEPIGTMYTDGKNIEHYVASDTNVIVYECDRYLIGYEEYEMEYQKLNWNDLGLDYTYPSWGAEEINELVSDYGLIE